MGYIRLIGLMGLMLGAEPGYQWSFKGNEIPGASAEPVERFASDGANVRAPSPPMPVANVTPNGIRLAWDASTSSAVAGYHIYQGIRSGVYSNLTEVGNSLSGAAPHPLGVTNYYAVTAYSTNAVESDYSLELAIAPGAPMYGFIFLQGSTNGPSGPFYDLTATPYFRLTNGAGGPLAWQWFRSRTEATTNWR